MRRQRAQAGATAHPSAASHGASGSRSPRSKMVAIGLASTVLHLVLVGTALAALREVSVAHADVARMVTAQSDFQAADMSHDAIRADALALFLPDETGASRADAVAALNRDVAEFTRFLRLVDSTPLPKAPAIGAQIRGVRPLQEQYAEDALRLSRTFVSDQDLARRLLPELDARYVELRVAQGAITDVMRAEADRRSIAAESAERNVLWRLAGSAVAAVLGTLALTLLLHRLGGALAVTLTRERDAAVTLQHSLLPDRIPQVPGLRLAARYVPGAVGTEVGGDWYDVIPLPSGEVGLVMGDVVGHDLDAAGRMGQLRSALRACAAEGAPPEQVLQQLNRLCVQQHLGGMATVVYAVFDPVLGTLRVANAGHYPPLLVTTEGHRYLESTPYPPVGAVREVGYTSTLHQLLPETLLVLYTDGLVERREEGVEDGMSRLEALAVSLPYADGLEELCDALLAGMLQGRSPDDDVALLTVAPLAVLGSHLDMTLPAQADQLSVLRRILERWLTEAGATEEETYEITVACSEATTNAIEHAYGPGRADVEVVCDVQGGCVTIAVRDWGQWREARGQDRGRGLQFMRALMDDVEVLHGDRGTRVVMRRQLGADAGAVPVGQQLPVHEARA